MRLEGLDALKSLEFLTDLGIPLISLDQNIDTTTAAGKMAFTMFAATAEYERTQIIQRVVGGRDRNIKAGRFPASVIPFGYKVIEHKLCLDPVTAPIARSIFENLAAGSTLLRESQRLDALGIPCTIQFTHKSLKRTAWSPTRLSHMVKSTVYTGQYEFK